MTTVVDPLGTPSVTFNRSGTAIVSVLGGTHPSDIRGGVGDEGNPIPRVCQTTVVMGVVSHSGGPPPTSFDMVLRLPDDAEIGDVVEVYVDPVSTEGSVYIFPNVGERIGSKPVSTGTNPDSGILATGNGGGLIFRKVSSVLWMSVGAAA